MHNCAIKNSDNINIDIITTATKPTAKRLKGKGEEDGGGYIGLTFLTS